MADWSDVKTRALEFRNLHHGEGILAIANAWDIGTARLVEAEDFPAVATTSAGVAWAHGVPDGERIEAVCLLDLAARIVERVGIPVSVDVERGFSSNPARVREFVGRLIDVGVVGINIEDGLAQDGSGLADPAILAEKIAEIRELRDARDVPLFVNARTDVFLAGVGDGPELLRETVRRAQIYADAGADGIFVPGAADLGAIATLVKEIPRPLNIHAGRGVPSTRELAAVGVARLSIGSGAAQASLAAVRSVLEELRNHGRYSRFVEDGVPYAAANAIFGA